MPARIAELGRLPAEQDSDRIDTRYTPQLRFELDEGVKKSLAISQMLHELLPDTNPSPDDAAADDAAAKTNPDAESQSILCELNLAHRTS